MQLTEKERFLYGNYANAVIRDKDCTIYRIEDSSGIAVMTRYEVFPGITLIYNDVHRQYLSVKEQINKVSEFQDMFEINHCKEGRIEFVSAQGDCLYIKKGDLAINTKTGVGQESFFPLSHYHGVSIEIDLKCSPKNLSEILKDVDVDLFELRTRFCSDPLCSILREKVEFEHLFSELYNVPEPIRKGYYKVKTLEILLFLSKVNIKKEINTVKYYNKALVAAIKEIRNYLINNLDDKITLEQLATKYNVPMTSMKKCFKEVYGNSIHAYVREYRIKKAAELLKNTDYDINKIASLVGYDNASKFANSFKKITGINPREYRKL